MAHSLKISGKLKTNMKIEILGIMPVKKEKSNIWNFFNVQKTDFFN